MTFPRIQRLRRALATAVAGAALLATGTAGATPHHVGQERHDHAPGPAWNDDRLPDRYAPYRTDRDGRYGDRRYDDAFDRGRFDPLDRRDRFLDRRSAALFREFDRDRSGRLDAGERASLASHLRRDVRSGDRQAANTARAARLIRASDSNRDRELSDRELRAMLRDTPLAQVFAAFDSNSDRMLAYTELDRAPLLSELRRADLDRSGYLSWQELDDYLTEDSRVRPRPRPRVRWAPPLTHGGHQH